MTDIERKRIRPQTAREIESDNEPRCLYDPAKIAHCTNHEFPPQRERCERCLVNSIVSDLEDECTSEALRWFLAYRNFLSVDKK